MSLSRLQEFNKLKDHAWLGKLYAKCSKEELKEARAFLKANVKLDKTNFERAVNQMYLNTTAKPKRWLVVMELLTCANSIFQK